MDKKLAVRHIVIMSCVKEINIFDRLTKRHERDSFTNVKPFKKLKTQRKWKFLIPSVQYVHKYHGNVHIHRNDTNMEAFLRLFLLFILNSCVFHTYIAYAHLRWLIIVNFITIYKISAVSRWNIMARHDPWQAPVW